MKVILVHSGFSSFVKADYEILKKKYSVKKHFIKPIKSPLLFLFEHLKLVLFLIRYIKKSDLVYTWFGDYHSFIAGLIAKLFNKKHIIVIGGYDAVSIPDISYGIFFKKNLRAKMVLQSYSWAYKILSVDQSLIVGENKYSIGENIVGIGNFDKKLISKSIILPTGYNPDKWNCENSEKKKQVLTVGLVNNRSYKIKGFDLFIECAKQLPNYDFVYVGLEENNIPPDTKHINNLTVIGRVDQNRLNELYCESKVFAQFSLTEGLPNTLCEAMLCKCNVVGSKVGGIPTVIRNNDFILKTKNVSDAIKIIERAMKSSSEIGEENRNFIKNNYSNSKRANVLFEIIDDLSE